MKEAPTSKTESPLAVALRELAFHAEEACRPDMKEMQRELLQMSIARARKLLESSPVETNGWQPIETAPKTGRTLLLGYYNSANKWRTMRGQWFSRVAIDEEWEEPENGSEGWYETSVENDDPPNCFWTEPTHWMPLPKPPGSSVEQSESRLTSTAPHGEPGLTGSPPSSEEPSEPPVVRSGRVCKCREYPRWAEECEKCSMDLQPIDPAGLPEKAAGDPNPLDPANQHFRKCLKGHISYSASFPECPSCKVERERSALNGDGK